MKTAIDKKWFLLTEESTYNPEFGWVPIRELRVYEEEADGYKLRITGVANGQNYEWAHVIRYDGQQHPVYDCKAMDSVLSNRVSDSKDIGIFYKNGAIVGTYFYEIRIDEKGREFLHVATSGIASSGQPYFKVLKYAAAKL